MVNTLAQPADVRGEIDTGLSNSDINHYLDDAAFENDRKNGAGSQDDAVRKRIEWKLAAVKILEGKEKEASREGRESASITYSASAVDRLKREIDDLDESGELVEERRLSADFEVF